MNRWLGGVRLRTAIAAAVVVEVAGAVAAFGFVQATQTILTHNVDNAVRQRIAEVKAGLRDDEASEVIETFTGNTTLVQVLDSTGKVVATSVPAGSKPPLANRSLSVGRTVKSTRPWPTADDAPYRIWEGGVTTAKGPHPDLANHGARPQPARPHPGRRPRRPPARPAPRRRDL